MPVLKTSNSVKLKEKNKLKNIDRNKIYLTQTPQAFHYKTLLNLQKKQLQKLLMMQICLSRLIKK